MFGWFKQNPSKNNTTEEETVDEQIQPSTQTDNNQGSALSPESTPPAPEEIPTDPEQQKISMLDRLKQRLSKSRSSFIERIDDLFLGKKTIDDDLLDELEEILITADLGVATTTDLIDNARNQVDRKELTDPQTLKSALKQQLLDYIIDSDEASAIISTNGQSPIVIMVVGVNGVGKTTTIGKMAHKFVQSGKKVLLVAADTFRAAAVDQLQIWGKRINADVVAQKTGVDPSAVVFDGLESAKSKNYDVIIVDTAGRLHTKVNLMEELKKIKRVMDKKIPGAPHEVMLVLDATTGQNGISQAKLFNDAVGLTGLALTKLDGTAKGGIVINICREFNIPIRFIGIGEQMDDLRDFNANEFVDAFFATTD